jgi:hypothetical protein
MQKPFVKQTCGHCGIGHYVESHDCGDWWLECNECRALMFCYKPMPHQDRFHSDYHKYKMFAGGRKSVAAIKSDKIGGTLTA